MGKVILRDGASILDYTIDWSDWEKHRHTVVHPAGEHEPVEQETQQAAR